MKQFPAITRNEAGLPVQFLIVDDSAFARENLKHIIESFGAQVAAEAEDGLVAITEYERVHPDVVLMDITMQAMDGIAAARKIVGRNPGARIIMVSSVGYQENIVAALQRGAPDTSSRSLLSQKCFMRSLSTCAKKKEHWSTLRPLGHNAGNRAEPAYARSGWVSGGRFFRRLADVFGASARPNARFTAAMKPLTFCVSMTLEAIVSQHGDVLLTFGVLNHSFPPGGCKFTRSDQHKTSGAFNRSGKGAWRLHRAGLRRYPAGGVTE